MQKIPNLTELRAKIANYDNSLPINPKNALYNDPLVDPRDKQFGFDDASSYYSRPLALTGEALPGVPNYPLIRLDIAKRLVVADKFLMTDPEVKSILGAPAHIRIDDALRPYQVQKFAYEVAWPKIIKQLNPSLSDSEIQEQVLHYCAKPNENTNPGAHLTGGALDVALVNADSGIAFDRGHIGGTVNGTAYPDFYEGYHLIRGQSDISNFSNHAELPPEDSEIIQSRRVLFHAMTVVAGLICNPREIWHYGKGDPFSEFIAGSKQAYYDIATLPDWYLSELGKL